MKLKQTVICAGTSVLMSVTICMTVWFIWFKPPAMVTFDIKGTTNAFLRQSAKLNLNSDERRQILTRFDHSVITATREYADEHHVAILVSPAVVTGLPDATPEIQARLAELMKAGSQK
ncbi:TrbI F-type domain-containing protein [Mixta intestinalis]|uniref:Type-F conjugative transfer system protein TrbI n=1 Tax=Mixta intestinalis TaxID=1615494 RepID=A0A6P1Q8C4_9GAMM|nr:TrbI F-type domain-containing protein [Mixta intestinalis]QHM74025.1 hypothetical protein C7M51_04386 [Mixta intestinalis]